MNLLEYQLDDVRRALGDYQDSCYGHGDSTKRQALRDLVDRVVEIARPAKSSSKVTRHVLGARGKYYPITEEDELNSLT